MYVDEENMQSSHYVNCSFSDVVYYNLGWGTFRFIKKKKPTKRLLKGCELIINVGNDATERCGFP